MRPDDYRAIVLKILDGKHSSGMIPTDMKGYFNGHWPRFQTHVEMFRDNLSAGDANTVLDIGTEFPFSSLYLSLTRGAWVTFAGLSEGGASLDPFVQFAPLNLNLVPAPWPRADLVICTECLEHLPVPIPPVLQWLKQRTLRYLFLSFPCGGAHASDYERDFSAQYDPGIAHRGHVREYTAETARALVDSLGMEIEDIRNSSQPAYGAPIMNVLLRRPD